MFLYIVQFICLFSPSCGTDELFLLYSNFVRGVVCSKNVKHKRMVSEHRNAKVLILGGALEYHRVPNKLASIDRILEQVYA